ncbi:MAG TPA: gamma-glutamylcyclotransferase family protein [Solirubrobacteraceae bacterium]|nr:gamma-glutamylcyclotransferase family protein [Solirubrobacteraceae bacterium]
MPPRRDQQFVFAYGSLVRDLAAALHEGGARACRLQGHRRCWNVAMDNAVSLPGYKYYLDARDSSRPEVLVTFLNLIEAPGQLVNGVLYPVEDERLAQLDRRERNYLRVEVTGQLDVPVQGRAWTYLGRPEAVRRFEDGVRARRAVVDGTYLEAVRAGFELLGEDALGEFDASTDPHACHVLELRRIELD